jgi:hypothetical protein
MTSSLPPLPAPPPAPADEPHFSTGHGRHAAPGPGQYADGPVSPVAGPGWHPAGPGPEGYGAHPTWPVAPPTYGPGTAYSTGPSYSATGGASFLPPPAVWPVILFSCFFGLFGIISAVRRSSAASKLGISGGRYWVGFGAGLAANVVVGFVVAVLTLGALLSNIVMTPGRLADQIVNNNTDQTATAATCAIEDVTTSGVGTYVCAVSYDDGTQADVTVTVTSNGDWHYQ